MMHMFISAGDPLADLRALAILKGYGAILLAAIILATPVVPKFKEVLSKHDGVISKAADVCMASILIVLFIFSISFVIAGQNNPFLYGNF